MKGWKTTDRVGYPIAMYEDFSAIPRDLPIIFFLLRGVTVPLLVFAGCVCLLNGCAKSGESPVSHATISQNESSSEGTSTNAERPSIEEGAPDISQSSPVPGGVLREVDAKELTAALRAVNPGFTGEALMEDQAGMIVVAINAPEVSDITPLAGLRIHKLDLYQCSVSDLSPLRGLPLIALAMDRTKVTDLRPLAGMPLEYLSLSETEVSDLTPLARCPLKQLNLVRTKVSDLSPLAHCPLESLWLNETPVKDLSPLRNVPLVSLTIAGTPVADLSPLKGMPLKRLHIARSQVTDLTPLRWLRLERLVFTPSRTKTGLDIVRNMPTLREIGTAFGEADWGIEDRLMLPDEFWALYDTGQLQE